MTDQTLDAINALRLDIARLEAKVDAKPSITQMYMSVFLMLFGLASVIVGTIATLHTLGFIR